MKLGKPFVMANLVERLLKGECILKGDVIKEFDITADQFHRYVAAIKKYMAIFHEDLELTYRKSENHYRLRRKRGS